MPRPEAPYRRVEDLAKECAAMLRWLRGPGTAASESEFATRLRAYRALCEAVGYLSYGRALLKKHGALLGGKKTAQPTTQRSADSFTADELALFKDKEAVLTPDGWVVGVPLVQHVDRVRDELRESGAESGDKQALKKILERAALSSGKSVLATLGNLPALQTKVSRLRTLAITKRSQKVSPTE